MRGGRSANVKGGYVTDSEPARLSGAKRGRVMPSPRSHSGIEVEKENDDIKS